MLKLNVKLLEINNELENKQLAVLDGDFFTSILEAPHEKYRYEEWFTKLVHLTLKPGDLVLDVGANLGYHTVTMAELVDTTGTVIAFEPQRIIYQQLNCNVFLNKLSNVTTLQFAVGNSTDTVFISPQNYFHVGKWPNVTNIGDTSINTSSLGDPVAQITIDSLNLTQLNFMKIDIQGSELNCLMGAKNTLMTNKPIIFIEIEEKQLVKFNTTTIQLIEYIKSLDYTLHRIVLPSYVTDDYICLPNTAHNFDPSKYPYELRKV